jgi:uncharacterized protein YdaU (DUF1376 family)
MGVLIQSINALDVANLSEKEIIRKILQTLPKPRYNIVKVLLKDFTTLTITEVVNKICSHEMFMMEDMESSTSHSSAKKDLALKASEKTKSKKNNAKPPSSSSESEDKSDSSEAESNDAKLALLMKKTTKMLSRIGKKGYNYDPKKQKFRASRRSGEGSNQAMIIYHMIAPSLTSECQAQPRRNHPTSPITRRRVNIILSWSMNG